MRPDTAIENYHTEFSGITKEALDPVRLMSVPLYYVLMYLISGVILYYAVR